MKRKLLILITVCSMLCLVACGAESNSDVNAIIDDETTAKPPVVEVTAEPTTEPSSEVVEATAEPTPTEEPVVEATPEPTEVPKVVYEGIDMESDLSGEEWINTFVGIIDEPKVVVYNDETGRKEIIEEGAKVIFNPEVDVLALYLPEGYKYANLTKDIFISEMDDEQSHKAFYLDVEKTRERKRWDAAIYVKYEGEESPLKFDFWSE